MKEFILIVFLLLLTITWFNIVILTDYENVFELKSTCLANDSTKIVLAELHSYVVSEFDGKVRQTDNTLEFIKFKDAIKNNDTIYVYDKYKGLLPLINWPLVKIGGYISTDIK